MTPPERSCRGRRRDGTPCRAPSNLVDHESGWCPAHDPRRADERREAARRGGAATARKLTRRGLDLSELGSLETVEDCRRACELVYRAVASGQLGHREGSTAVRAIEAAQKVLATAAREELDALRSELRRLKRVRAVR